MNRNRLIKRASGAFLLTALFALSLATTTAQAQYRDDRYRDHRNRDGNYGDRNYRGYWDKDRTKEYAFIFAYQYAYPEARYARERGYRVDHDDAPGYRNDVTGYLNWMGDRNVYRDYYRKGYELGWKEGQSNKNCRYERRDAERILGDSFRNVYGHNWDSRNQGYYDDRYGRDDRYRRNDRYDNDDYRNGRYDRNSVYRIAQENGYRDGLRRGEEDRNRRQDYDVDDWREYRDGTHGYRSEYGNRDQYKQAYRDGFRRGYDEGYRRGRNGNSSRRPFPFPWPF